eukprot:TRINITY_DN4837_c0_g1_i2.p1 TRINITY_DN4837_c0_g1~~TRINITY_DN4837_c0_g1_i2.p1  ORF type:complete len:240 (-),score=12.24 TRINITY_DN4837_c0_g1_i2:446-1165(-)
MPKEGGILEFYRAFEELPYKQDEILQWMYDIDAAVRRIRSGSSETSVFITFRNETDTKVKTFWIDYSGKEVEYVTIAPGSAYVQQTSMEDAWVFRRALSSSRLVFDRKIVVYPSDQPQGGKILIQNPQALQWTQENHRLFPGLFKERTRLLLLYHKFIQKDQPKPIQALKMGKVLYFHLLTRLANSRFIFLVKMFLDKCYTCLYFAYLRVFREHQRLILVQQKWELPPQWMRMRSFPEG